MSEINVGDRVRCVNDGENASDYLEYGKIYVVDRVVTYRDVPPHLKLISVEKYWCRDRFVKVEDAAEPQSEAVHRFASGAVRGTDASGTRFDLISPVALEALAETYAEGAAKYGDNNWLKGIPTSDLLNHALRHLNMWQRGDTSEPHLAHAAWNVLAMIHFERTRPELVVRPYAAASEKGGA
jgi:hypothetical protein